MNVDVHRRLTAKEFDQELLDLYDYYVHGKITKREFLDGAAKFAVGGITAVALLSMLSPNYALAQQVAADDPDIVTSRIDYPSPEGHGTVNALLVKPADAGAVTGAVLVVHENRGLNPYIEDVARRLGKAGFIALAPDGLTPAGGYPGTDDEGREMQRGLDRTKLLNDFFAAYEYLDGREDTGKIGATGFCYGGGVVNALAVEYPGLAAAVPFYGGQPDPEAVSNIEAPLLIHYGELDDRVNAGWPAYQEALDAADKTYTVHFYEAANHGFHNDTTPRYDAEAAELAWERTIAFFNEHLS